MADAAASTTRITADPAFAGEGSTLRVDLPILERLQLAAGPTFVCPGESRPISQAVHFSRLARFYPACRECEHSGCAPGAKSAALESDVAKTMLDAAGLTWREGVRGVYLNDLRRHDAEQLAAAVAVGLWEQLGRRGHSDDDRIDAATHRAGPEIVVGRDARTSAADIACGVVQGLRRMGCRVVDLGCVSRPTIDFGVYHLRASAGLYVTGQGSHAAMTGLDVVGRDGIPWSEPGRLALVRERLRTVIGRPTRHGGTLRTLDAETPQRAEFQRHWHGLRQCRVGVASDDPLHAQQLQSWFAGSAAEVVPLDLWRPATSGGEESADLRRRLRTELREHHLGLIVRLGDDGRWLQLFDETGRLVDPADWLLRIAERQIALYGPIKLVVPTGFSATVRGRLKAHGTEVLTVAGTHESLVTHLLESGAILAADGEGRMWLAEHYPVCDAFVTLALLLRLASESGQPVSHWAT